MPKKDSNTLPLRVSTDALQAFLDTCLQCNDSRKAIKDIARVLPKLTFRELALYIEGAAHFEEVEGSFRVVVTA